jgi:hypothetical protein
LSVSLSALTLVDLRAEAEKLRKVEISFVGFKTDVTAEIKMVLAALSANKLFLEGAMRSSRTSGNALSEILAPTAR